MRDHKIAIIGLGYVGLPLSLQFARSGVNVLGVDTDPAKISDCNITNYSIYLKQPENLLFGYWEYLGADFAADAAKMAADPKTQEWWAVCMPCQEPLATRKDGDWWSMMEVVFHHD